MFHFPSAIPKFDQKDLVHLRLKIGNKLPGICESTYLISGFYFYLRCCCFECSTARFCVCECFEHGK